MPDLYTLCNSYLSDCNFCVPINNIFSALYLIISGILQGSVLGPSLFNLLFNDIPYNNNILMPEQVGFRAKHSNQLQMIRVVGFFSVNLDTNTPVVAIFLEVAKAFDKVWYKALI